MKDHKMFLYKHSIESEGIYIEAETLEEAIFEVKSDFGYNPGARILEENYHCVSTTPHLLSNKSL